MSNMANLVARFRLNKDGRPKFVREGDLKHFEIELAIDQPPTDTFAVTYRLHSSYYDPVRESLATKENFKEELTSYGDYRVRADVRRSSRTVQLSEKLSEALRKGHADESSPEILAAIQEISEH